MGKCVGNSWIRFSHFRKAELGLWSSEAGESAARGALRPQAPLQNGANGRPAGQRRDKPGHARPPSPPALRTKACPVAVLLVGRSGGLGHPSRGFKYGVFRRQFRPPRAKRRSGPGSSEKDRPTHSPSALTWGCRPHSLSHHTLGAHQHASNALK